MQPMGHLVCDLQTEQSMMASFRGDFVPTYSQCACGAADL